MFALRSESVKRYGFALVAVFLAFLVRFLMIPVWGDERFSLGLFLVAIVFCAWYCGIWPSIMAAVVSMLTVWYFFFEPNFSFRFAHPLIQISALCSFAMFSGLIIALGESNRRAHQELENRVRQRTAELSVVNDRLRALTSRLLQAQDEERRRLARELHDSVGQLLSANAMSIGTLKRMQLPAAAQRALSDSDALVQEALREIRTISHLLHPPLLDELGLLPAVKWCVEGFSKRSGIKVAFNGPAELGRLDPDVELAAYRVVQECLTNVHRHSGSSDGIVEIATDCEGLEVIVRDHGTGIPPGKLEGTHGQVGVGLRGMAERIGQLGGSLEVQSSRTGTMVRVKLPISEQKADSLKSNAASA
jgi:signal transduction histidine kinase